MSCNENIGGSLYNFGIAIGAGQCGNEEASLGDTAYGYS